MPAVGLYLQTALGVVFVLSSLGKFRKPDLFKRALVHYEALAAHPRVRNLLGRIVPPIEFLVGALLIGHVLSHALAVLIPLALLLPFTYVIAVNARHGLTTSCGCGMIDSKTGFPAVARNIVLMSIAVISGLTNPTWERVNTSDRLATLFLAILMAMALMYLPAAADEVLHQREHV